MNETALLQAEALLVEIARRTEAEAAALQAAAAREADAIAGRAHADALRQRRRTVAEMRATRAERERALHAELDAQARRAAAAQAAVLLQVAAPRLRPALVARWCEPAARARWIDGVLALAAQRLPRHGWTLQRPLAWNDDDERRVQQALRRLGVEGTRVVAAPALDGGLRVELAGVRLDATPEALLADRARVQAELLALAAEASHG